MWRHGKAAQPWGASDGGASMSILRPSPAVAPDPAAVSAAGLMALSALALAPGREAPALSERPGSVATRRRGQGHEIREIRPYTEGDDARHLDAAASARLGSPQLRSFHEDRERSLVLIADFRRPMLWGTDRALRSVIAARGLALAGWAAMRDRGSVGVIALTDAGPESQSPRPREHGMALVAGCLARAHERALDLGARRAAERLPTRPLGPELMQITAHIPRGAAVLLATGLDLPGEGCEAALAALAGRSLLRLALVEDAFERAPPAGALPVSGALRPQWAAFDDLAAARAARAEALANLLAAAGGRVIRFTADTVGFDKAAPLPELLS